MPQVDDVKYIKPKVFSLNVAKNITDSIRESGYNISEADIGMPYRYNSHRSECTPVYCPDPIKGYEEQEIIIIDQCYEVVDKFSNNYNPMFIEGRPIDAISHSGIMDPRPVLLAGCRNKFEKIFSNGGIFIVFASYSNFATYSVDIGFGTRESLNINLWSFLDRIRSIETEGSCGMEIFVDEKMTKSSFGDFFKKYSSESRFDCTLKFGGVSYLDCIPLYRNKYNEIVGAVLSLEKKSAIFIFPQIENKAAFINELFKEHLPQIFPSFFPYSEKNLWMSDDVYSLPEIVELKAEQCVIRKNAESAIDEIEAKILNIQDDVKWLYQLLTDTGDSLVKAVIQGFKYIGFNDIKDMDDIYDEQNVSRREDVQIHDRDITFLIDVKGISGYPHDDDVQQINKHVILRMQEASITNFKGISLINHQRHLPPMSRENNQPFRNELVTLALETKLGLLTTWDFFKLIMSFKLNKWTHDMIRSIFFENGRISCIPENYSGIGYVAKCWKKNNIISVLFEDMAIQIGDRLAIEYPTHYREITATSLQVNLREVTSADNNTSFGLKLANDMMLPSEKAKVYKVQK